MSQAKLSIYLCRLLRHAPEDAGLDMDRHGWVSTAQLIENVNKAGRYRLTMPQLEQLVAADNKGRYRFSPDKSRMPARMPPLRTRLPPPNTDPVTENSRPAGVPAGREFFWGQWGRARPIQNVLEPAGPPNTICIICRKSTKCEDPSAAARPQHRERRTWARRRSGPWGRQ